VITGVHHVGIAVRDLAGGLALWGDTLGLPVLREAVVADQQVRAALLGAGTCEIELLEPTAPEGPVGRFLARRGAGLHHLCVESDDVDRELTRFHGTGVELIDPRPRPGLVGRIAFLHPRSCAGVLVEVATPTARTPPVAAPLTVAAVHLVVEDVPATVQLYGGLFGFPVRMAHPNGSLAQLAAGGVALQLASTAATGGRPGLSLLRLTTPEVQAVSDRLDGRGIAYRRDAVGLVVGPGAALGVPLIIHGPPREGRGQDEEATR
jgi:methylmalonyl-CoA epimerase